MWCFSCGFDCTDSSKSVVLFLLLSDYFLDRGVQRFCGERLVDNGLIAHLDLDCLFTNLLRDVVVFFHAVELGA